MSQDKHKTILVQTLRISRTQYVISWDTVQHH